MKQVHGQYKCKDHETHTSYDTSNRKCKECSSKLKRFCQYCNAYYDASNFSKHVKTHKEAPGGKSLSSSSSSGRSKIEKKKRTSPVMRKSSPTFISDDSLIPHMFLNTCSPLRTRSVAPVVVQQPQHPLGFFQPCLMPVPTSQQQQCGNLLAQCNNRLITPNQSFIGLQQPFIIQGIPIESPQASNQSIIIRAEFKKSDEEREEVDLIQFPGYLHGMSPLWMYGPSLVSVTVVIEIYQGPMRLSKKWFKVSDFYFALQEQQMLSEQQITPANNDGDDDDEGDDDHDRDSDGHSEDDDLLFLSPTSDSTSSDDQFGSFDFLDGFQFSKSADLQPFAVFPEQQSQQQPSRKKQLTQPAQIQKSTRCRTQNNNNSNTSSFLNPINNLSAIAETIYQKPVHIREENQKPQGFQQQPYKLQQPQHLDTISDESIDSFIQQLQDIFKDQTQAMQFNSQMAQKDRNATLSVDKQPHDRIGSCSEVENVGERNMDTLTRQLAQKHSRYTDSYALVIGCSKYGNNLEQLQTTTDCQNLATALEQVGFNVKVLRNAQVTKQNIFHQLFQMFKQVGNKSRVFIHFSGHGQILPQQDVAAGYFCCVDYAETKLDTTTIRYEDLYSFIHQYCPAQEALVSLDCCHSGSALTVPLNQRNSEKSIFTIASCQSQELAHETVQGGLFTIALCNVLNSGNVQYYTAEEIAGQVADVVQQVTQLKQSPVFGYNGSKKDSMILKSTSTSRVQYPLQLIKKYRSAHTVLGTVATIPPLFGLALIVQVCALTANVPAWLLMAYSIEPMWILSIADAVAGYEKELFEKPKDRKLSVRSNSQIDQPSCQIHSRADSLPTERSKLLDMLVAKQICLSQKYVPSKTPKHTFSSEPIMTVNKSATTGTAMTLRSCRSEVCLNENLVVCQLMLLQQLANDYGYNDRLPPITDTISTRFMPCPTDTHTFPHTMSHQDYCLFQMVTPI